MRINCNAWVWTVDASGYFLTFKKFLIFRPSRNRSMEVKLTEEDKIKALCGGICKYEKIYCIFTTAAM